MISLINQDSSEVGIIYPDIYIYIPGIPVAPSLDWKNNLHSSEKSIPTIAPSKNIK